MVPRTTSPLSTINSRNLSLFSASAATIPAFLGSAHGGFKNCRSRRKEALISVFENNEPPYVGSYNSRFLESAVGSARAIDKVATEREGARHLCRFSVRTLENAQMKRRSLDDRTLKRYKCRAPSPTLSIVLRFRRGRRLSSCPFGLEP